MPSMPVCFVIYYCIKISFNEKKHPKNFQEHNLNKKRKISVLFSIISSGVIDDKPLRFRGELYHPYHFNCTTCGIELNSEAREVRSRPGYAANEMVRLNHVD